MTDINRFFWVNTTIVPVRATATDAAEMVTQLLFGECVMVLESHKQWLKVRSLHDQYEGWIDSKQVVEIIEQESNFLLKSAVRQRDLIRRLNGPQGTINTVKGSLLPSLTNKFEVGGAGYSWMTTTEIFNAKDVSSIALEYLNSPYLWGGRSPFGIDCSGFTQAVMRFVGVQLLRDASQQEKQGKAIEFEELSPGDLAFFHNSNGKVIHVGLLMENNKIIHASGCVRIDEIRKEGIWNEQKQKMTHQTHSFKRYLM